MHDPFRRQSREAFGDTGYGIGITAKFDPAQQVCECLYIFLIKRDPSFVFPDSSIRTFCVPGFAKECPRGLPKCRSSHIFLFVGLGLAFLVALLSHKTKYTTIEATAPAVNKETKNLITIAAMKLSMHSSILLLALGCYPSISEGVGGSSSFRKPVRHS